MATAFEYEALDADGRALKGRLEAASEREAQRHLESQGLALITLGPAKTAGSVAEQILVRRGVTEQDRILTLKQLALLLKAGVALVSGITTLRNQATHPVMAKAFAEMERRLRSGETFTTALTAAMPTLPPYVFQLAAAGEAIGHLGESLDDAAAQMAYEQRIRQDVRNALTYPTVLVTVGIAAVLFIFIVVVPRFSTMVAGAKKPLPWLSSAVLNTGMFLNTHKLLVFLVAAVAIGAVWHIVRTPALMAQVREHVSRLPLIGQWFLEAETARWASMLGTMLGNGVNLIAALGLARDAVTLASLRDRLAQATKLVRGGQSLSIALSSQHALSGTAISLIQVGENSGELPTMLRSLAKLYEDTGRQRMTRFLLLLEPAAILFIGVFVGGIVAAIMLAITSVNQVAL
jgi:general secretion pathway protein F